MTLASKNSINRLKEMVGNDEKTRRFIRCKQGIELYNMSRTTFTQLAIEAGAAYKINSIVLVDREIFEQYLENFKIPHQVV